MAAQEESAHAAPGIADQRRGQMLRAALDVITERGFADTRIADIDPRPFSVFLCALVDGLAIQIALEDPAVDPISAYELCMRYVADRLGFHWTPGHSERATRKAVRARAEPGR